MWLSVSFYVILIHERFIAVIVFLYILAPMRLCLRMHAGVLADVDDSCFPDENNICIVLVSAI